MFSYSVIWIELSFSLPIELIVWELSGPRSATTIVIVRQIAEMGVPLASFITSRIVCISATLYGAVETLDVKESTNRQVIKSCKKRINHQYCYSVGFQVALYVQLRGTCALCDQQDTMTNVPFKWCVAIINIDAGITCQDSPVKWFQTKSSIIWRYWDENAKWTETTHLYD